MLNRYLFKWVDGEYRPFPPTEREPDGIDLVDIDHIYELTGLERPRMEKKWDDAFKDYQPSPAEAVEPAPVAEPTESPLVFAVEPDQAYRTFITTEQLVDRDGRPAAGRCCYSERLILISSHYPPNTWENTWFHEAAHAQENAFPCPQGGEDQREWETTFSRKANKQFEAQGGAATLLSMKPIAGMAPVRVCVPTGLATRDARLRRKFSHLSEYQFDIAKTLWEEHELNPWLNHFRVRVERGEVQIVVTLPGLLTRAMTAAGFLGNPRRQFVLDATSRYPVSCVSTIEREVNGKIATFTAEAFWVDVYGDNSIKIDPLVLAKPRDSIGAIADGKVIRYAYADVCGTLTMDEETRRPVIHRDAARTWPDYRRR